MRVRINDLAFDTAELPVGFLGVEQEPQVIRDIGEQRRRNLQNATRYIYNGWYRMGVGWNRAARNDSHTLYIRRVYHVLKLGSVVGEEVA